MSRGDLSLGAGVLGDGRARFVVWPRLARQVEVHLLAPRQRLVPMELRGRGYHQVAVALAAKEGLP